MSSSVWGIAIGALVLGFAMVWLMWGDKKPAPPRLADDPSTRPAAAAVPAPMKESWHEVLGVRDDAPASDVLDAYTNLLQQYDPQKTATLAPELRELADHRSKRIVKAYEEFRAQRGTS